MTDSHQVLADDRRQGRQHCVPAVPEERSKSEVVAVRYQQHPNSHQRYAVDLKLAASVVTNSYNAGFNVVMVMLVNIWADATGRRLPAAMFNLALQLFGTACLVAWKIPLGLHIVAYLLAACDGPLSPLYMAWANLLCGKDKQVRAMTLAMMNAFGNATTTIIQQFAYPVLDAPEYKVGFRLSLGLICGMVGWVFVVRYCELKVQQRKGESTVQVVEGIALDQSVSEKRPSTGIQPEKMC